jgi:hypothetical protein
MQNGLFDKVEQDALSAAKERREAIAHQDRLSLTSGENVIGKICMFKEILVLAFLIYGIYTYIRPEKCDLIKHDLH